MIKDIKIIIIGGSAGSYGVVRNILSSVPGDFPLPIILCLHRLREVRNGFAESLNLHSRLPVIEPFDKQKINSAFVYLSPANYHMLIEPGGIFALSTDSEINFSRPSLDVTFESAGFAFKEKMAGILLSGSNSDGAKGLFSAFRNGAYSVVHDPEDARFRIMPEEALKYFQPHKILTGEAISEFINSLRFNVYG